MANPKTAQQALQQQIADLQAQLAEYTGLEQENTDLRVQVSSLQASLLAATQQIADAKTAIANLTAAFEAYKASHPDPAPEPTPEPADDWAAVSAGALVAYRLIPSDPGVDMTQRHRLGNNLPFCLWVPDENTYTKPVIDDLGMRFDIEPNKGAADAVFKIPPFGMNSKLRARWVFRGNAAFINTVFRMGSGGYPGVKMMLFATLAASSPSGKFVLSTMDQHKFLQGYRYSWATGATENFEPAIDGNATDFDWQPKQGQPATCLYSVVNKTPQGVAVPGCDTLVADKDIILEVEIDTFGEAPGTDGKAWDAEYRCYMTVDGVRKLVFDYGKTTRGYQPRRSEPFTALWAVPFMTGRDLTQTFPSTPSVWLRELVIKGEPTQAVPVPDPVPVPTPTPKPSSFIPAPGTFAEFTLNKPQDVGMDAGTLANWSGGTLIPDYGTAGAVAYHGGREHSAQSLCQKQQAVGLLDIGSRLYVRKCSPVQANLQSLLTGTPLTYVGTPNDEWGAFPDGSPGPMHTYAGLCPVPAAWNNGKPGMVRVGQSAGASQPLMGESYAATWLYDLTKDAHTLADPAITRLTGSQNYRFDADQTVKSVVSDAPTACIDMARQGWWSFSRTASGSSRPWLSFTAKDGTVTNQAAPKLTLARWSAMHKFEDDDILCVLCDEPSFGTQRFGTVKLLALNALPGGAWVTVLPTLPASPTPMNECGYMGPRWSTILGAFVALDTNFNGGTTCRVWKLTPPPPGQRLTGTWTWTCETVTSADGSAINSANRGSVNGAWGRLVESVALRSLVWTRDVDKPGILIRLQGM